MACRSLLFLIFTVFCQVRDTYQMIGVQWSSALGDSSVQSESIFHIVYKWLCNLFVIQLIWEQVFIVEIQTSPPTQSEISFNLLPALPGSFQFDIYFTSEQTLHCANLPVASHTGFFLPLWISVCVFLWISEGFRGDMALGALHETMNVGHLAII